MLFKYFLNTKALLKKVWFQVNMIFRSLYLQLKGVKITLA